MDYLTNYYKNLSEQLQEKVLILENFLLEGKYIFGVNHTDRDASTQILKAADAMGYVVKDGGKHHMIHDPVSGELVTTVSKGTTQSHPGRHRAALLDLSSHQEKIGGFDRDTELKQIRKAMTADIGASGIFRGGRVLERNQRNLKENTSSVEPVNNTRQILSERRYIKPFESADGTNDVDWYGEHKNRSPKEFAEFIKTLTEKEKKRLTDPNQMYLHHLRKQLIHELDYHMTNPHLTDEHFHEVIPHLLDFAYPETIDNLDIPWDVLKTHAELDLVANPSRHEDKEMLIANREHQERQMQDYRERKALERNQRNLKENTSIVQPVNRASKILSERRYLPPDDNEGISDEDWYGEHENRSPKEFGEFIKGLIEKGMSKNSNPFSHMLKKAQIHQLDYHLANPNLTDEHFHEAVPHLLRFAYPETMNNLDIPWDVLKPHAELDLVANPSKHKDMVFRGRENMERILQDYKDGNLKKPK
jgi:RNAse (barnase) inhibitor barstar